LVLDAGLDLEAFDLPALAQALTGRGAAP